MRGDRGVRGDVGSEAEVRERESYAVLLSLKMEEEARSQGLEKEMAIHSSIVS